ncbi:MAG: hypothetical protein ACKVT2_21295 [Saprospiraceae bacterium]
MSLQVNLVSEVTNPGAPQIFEINGAGLLQRLSESSSPASTPGNTGLNNRNVQTDQDIRISLNWRTQGLFAHAINPQFKWKIEVLLERRGPGEFALPGGVITLDYGTGTFSAGPINPGSTVTFPGAANPNNTTVLIPGGTIPDGLYDVVVVLRLMHADGVSPCFLAAFADFGLVDFYREH